MDQEKLIQLFLYGVIGLAAFIFILFKSESSKKLDRIKAKEVGDGQHGKDRFMTYSEAQAAYTAVKLPWIIESQEEELPAGRVIHFDEKTRTALIDTSMTHLKMAAPTESSKTTCYVVPNIQYNLMAGKYNMIVPDLKGELHSLTAADAIKCGYKVYRLNFIDPTDTDRIDYFEDLNLYWRHYEEEGDLMSRVYAEDAAGEMAWDIVSSRDHSDSENPFFAKASKGVIQTLLLLVAMFGKDTQKHIGSVSNIVQGMLKDRGDPKDKSPRILKIMEKLPDDMGAKKYLGAAWAAAEETEANIYASVLGDLEPFVNGIAEQIIAKPGDAQNTFSYRSLIEEKCILYIMIPETKEQFKVFGTTIIKRLYNGLMAYAALQPGNKLPRTIYIPWEEFGLYSKVHNVEDWLSIMRGKGMITDLIYQDQSQLVKKYDENIMKILSNQCASSIYLALAPEDIETAERLSKSMGNKTIKTGSVSVSHDAAHQGSLFGGTSRSETEQMMERALMTTSEILHMGKDNIKLLLRRNQLPFKTALTQYFRKEWGLIPGTDPIPVKKNEITRIDYMTYEELLHAIDDYRFENDMIRTTTVRITETSIQKDNDEADGNYHMISKKLIELTGDEHTVKLLQEERYPELIKYMQQYRKQITPYDLQKLLEPLAE